MKLAGTGAAMADRAARDGRVAVANTTRCDVSESVASRIAAAGELLRESERLARGALALAIEAGGRLASTKAAAKHGEWLPGLAAAGIQPRTAQRAIELHRRAEEARALPGAEALSPSRALRMLPSVAGAGGTTGASAGATGALQAASGMVSRAFAAATVQGPAHLAAAVTPFVLGWPAGAADGAPGPATLHALDATAGRIATTREGMIARSRSRRQLDMYRLVSIRPWDMVRDQKS